MPGQHFNKWVVGCNACGATIQACDTTPWGSSPIYVTVNGTMYTLTRAGSGPYYWTATVTFSSMTGNPSPCAAQQPSVTALLQAVCQPSGPSSVFQLKLIFATMTCSRPAETEICNDVFSSSAPGSLVVQGTIASFIDSPLSFTGTWPAATGLLSTDGWPWGGLSFTGSQ